MHRRAEDLIVSFLTWPCRAVFDLEPKVDRSILPSYFNFSQDMGLFQTLNLINPSHLDLSVAFLSGNHSHKVVVETLDVSVHLVKHTGAVNLLDLLLFLFISSEEGGIVE
jgi:hypothetical protein